MSQKIHFAVNGLATQVSADPKQSLLDVLRNDLQLKATRLGCGLGQCGACRVIVDGHAVAACDTPMWAVADKNITTLEGLGTPQAPHPLQSAFIAHQAAQCGFCTSGMLMTAAALLQRQPHPSENEIKQALEDNLCRCGIHQRVLQAVMQVAA